jgi:hypothetical protein
MQREKVRPVLWLYCPSKLTLREGAALEDVLRGWGEIAKYLRCHPTTAQRYERERGLRIHRTPGGGRKSPVLALKTELDDWLGIDVPESQAQGANRASTRSAELAAPVLDRILGIGRETKLYRRNYVLRFDLRSSTEGVCANVEYAFELCNATDQNQPYFQEMTLDDSDRGYIKSLSFFVDGKSTYHLKRPPFAKKFIGYLAYRGPRQSVAPNTKGITYVCKASWVIHRGENDIWYNHMGLPTVGVKLETHASAAFEITASFSRQELVMKGEHMDIAWRRRP